LKYVAGSKLWCDAVKEGKIAEDEYFVLADSRRGLGPFTKEEIINYCKKAQLTFYFQPRFALRLLIKSLQNNDLGFLQSHILFIFSNIKKIFNFLSLTHSGK